MKEVFFTFVAISVPILAVGGLVYMLLHGLYRVFDDWRLDRELRQLRREVLEQQPSAGRRPPLSERELLAAFDDRPPAPEPEGLAVFPLDPDWEQQRHAQATAVDFAVTLAERANGAPPPGTLAVDSAVGRPGMPEVDRPPQQRPADPRDAQAPSYTVVERVGAKVDNESAVDADSAANLGSARGPAAQEGVTQQDVPPLVDASAPGQPAPSIFEDADALPAQTDMRPSLNGQPLAETDLTPADETSFCENEQRPEQTEGAATANDPLADDRSLPASDAIDGVEVPSVEPQPPRNESDAAPPVKPVDQLNQDSSQRRDEWPERTLD